MLHALEANSTLSLKIKSALTGKDYYITENGTTISTKKDTGSIFVNDDGSINIENAEKLDVEGTNKDDNIKISFSEVNDIDLKDGTDSLELNYCNFNSYKKSNGTHLYTGHGESNIVINGDFDGLINLRNNKLFKKTNDKLLINGDNNGKIKASRNDQVYVTGENNGKITR